MTEDQVWENLRYFLDAVVPVAEQANVKLATQPDDSPLSPIRGPNIEAYREIGFEGVYRPDHIPTMEGDSNDRPSYPKIGRLFAIGYLKGLRQARYR